MQENYNATIHFPTGNDQLDLELLNIELQTSYVDLIATLLGIISAVKAKQIIIQRMIQQQQSPSQQEQQNQQVSNKTNSKISKMVRINRSLMYNTQLQVK